VVAAIGDEENVVYINKINDFIIDINDLSI